MSLPMMIADAQRDSWQLMCQHTDPAEYIVDDEGRVHERFITAATCLLEGDRPLIARSVK